ncbi:unnamed protein product [Brassica oleracea]|uniref:(rape) hypothetical protein n=1 Tax=Brassica napus TaxID=3708 RepID=A0A816U9T4_BRANA|nr:unnamed protein product [Brassica napus]
MFMDEIVWRAREKKKRSLRSPSSPVDGLVLLRVQIWSKASNLRIEAESLKSDFIGVDLVRSTVCGGGFGVTGCSEYERVLYGLFGLAVVLRRVVNSFRGQWQVLVGSGGSEWSGGV